MNDASKATNTRPHIHSAHGLTLYCKGCDEWLLTSEFYTRSCDNRRNMIWFSQCKLCTTARTRARRRAKQ